eukprot:CAMPEP_0116567090 /NCGR_PEP_ID=MMETSP0397-20121206/14808_1 /TAXON_ID=216820 /ORGANISM="Cyclophora tenuis, Strain ECT3854" /LENGTH=66 /DNA_ID=CAMNT_0004094031 /DNA_START=91 /DNA_END=288 /DNA_ORIENTATION=+
MRILAPSMSLIMLFLSLSIEQPWNKLRHFDGNIFFMLGLGVLGGVLAIAMIMCEFDLIMRSSAIIL